MLNRLAVTAVLLALPAAAAAQDFGAEWLDRISNEVLQERGPQTPKPLTWTAMAGTAYYQDNNLFLTEQDEEKSGIIIPFVRGRLDYATPQVDIRADIMANYKFYTTDHDIDDDEERVYLHFRQMGPRHSVEITEVFQHVSDPSDAVFFARVERVVSNTIPKVTVDITPVFAFEARADLQAVRYRENDLGDSYDNNLARPDATLVWRSAAGIDVLAQVGYQDIEYTKGQDSGAPPDAYGYYIRGGFRGELLPALAAEVLAGFTHIETEFYRGTSVDDEDEDFDMAASLRYEVTETFKLDAGFTRMFTFAGGADSYQLVNRATLGAHWTVIEDLAFRLLGQFDRTDTQQGTDREFFSGSLAATWKASGYLVLDAGATYRKGDTVFDDETDTDFTNLIFHIGFALVYSRTSVSRRARASASSGRRPSHSSSRIRAVSLRPSAASAFASPKRAAR